MNALYQTILDTHSNSTDFVHTPYPSTQHEYFICYYRTLIDVKLLNEELLPVLHQIDGGRLMKLFDELPFTEKHLLQQEKDIHDKVLSGCILLFNPSDNGCITIQMAKNEFRAINAPEVEFSVIGPKDAFIESLDTNLLLIRRRLPIPELKIKEIQIGELTHSRCAIVYIETIANPINLERMIQRLNAIQTSVITDTTSVIQMIVDNKYSLFPQFIETERPDRLVHLLSFGGIGVLVDGSAQALSGPATIGQFLIAYEDYYLPWHIGSFFRILRIGAILFSILATPMYIAVLTYHYHIIPTLLLGPIISSRINLPFPPVIEVIFMELTIELLREAGARLPSKIGQTIGIVGGIVIGTASAQAALTSNILLIIVALSALSSFTVPIFHMSNTIRVIRYPFILAAQMLGLLGIFLCGCFLLTHLLRLKSLGTPFLQPFYPIRINDWADSIIRLPIRLFSMRPSSYRPLNRSKPATGKQSGDIDD
ncbi:spore germination protein [Paenibacillus sp. NPDC056579]|uniref:spore germination protein n=1 Tax=Paenibacillus sp. NPDC056579 TaxID=3345871 RepID=UPI0036744290